MARHDPERRHRDGERHGSRGRDRDGDRHRDGDRERRKRHRSRTVDPDDVAATAAAAAAAAGPATDSPRRSRRRDSLNPDDLHRPDARRSRHREREWEHEAAGPHEHGQDLGEVGTYRDEERDRRRRRSKKRHGGGGKDRKGKHRAVSGALLEEGRGPRLRGGGGGGDGADRVLLDEKGRSAKYRKNKRLLWILVAAAIAVIIIIIVTAAVLSTQDNDEGEGEGEGDVSSGPSKSNLDGHDPDSVPAEYKNTYLDPWSWYDTGGFNVTFTADTVGDLPVIGLMSEWDDSAAPNDRVPALDADWGSYASRPARGVNLGGWLALEPFIAPSLFAYDSSLNIIDEWSLCEHLGADKGATLERHYATFVTESTFRDIADAGLDHVRIPFGYWAVEVYDSDPYLFRTAWRYLLRGVEWARKYGLRVNLDLHGLPGSQNGWNHSGRWGTIGWLNGPDGQKNAQRSLEIHDRLSKFFARDRYRNVITHYGLANEPKMTALEPSDVVAWTQSAFDLVRANGVEAVVVFGDGFMGLDNWRGVLSGNSGLALDVHQYVIFNAGQIAMSRHDKVAYACDGWTGQTERSMDTATGFGPTLFAEWSQADTDCARYVTNVGWGNRWTGTYEDTLDADNSVLTPRCPTKDHRCSCNGQADTQDTSAYSAGYREFLLMFAEAQMHSFERGWGWWYWTWHTESAPLWSYKAGLEAGILPAKAYERSFDCSGTVPTWDDVPEYM